jgi:WD40 repeat protein
MTLTGHANSIMALQYQQEGYKMVSCSYDKTIKVWDMRMERLLSTLEVTLHLYLHLCYAFRPQHMYSELMDML